MPAKRFIQISLILVLLLASFGAANNVHAWGSCGSTYVIQRGDWLSRIAQTCGVTLSDLRAANPWTYYQYYIYPGQVLVIPGAYDGGYNNGSSSGFCGPTWDVYGAYYVVCPGDTLGSIARYYGVSWRYLQQVNGIWNPNIIYVGQVIRV